MALRNQPYIPLYIQDFMTDEKLIECSAESTGVYIRLMCVMHKSDEYGCILLKQKDKQRSDTLLNFAHKLCKYMPYGIEVIEKSLRELVIEGVLNVEGDKLLQKRMLKDNNISNKRSIAGRMGGVVTQFAKAKIKANSEYENENEIVNEIIDSFNNICGTKYKHAKSNQAFISGRLRDGYSKDDCIKVIKRKYQQWKKDPEMAKFIRIETMFRPTKFESYLNEKDPIKESDESARKTDEYLASLRS